jgi:hypothetical protein
MSIAINTNTRVRTARTAARPIRLSRPAPTRDEQLRDKRALLRHFVLAFSGVSAVLYLFATGGIGF